MSFIFFYSPFLWIIVPFSASNWGTIIQKGGGGDSRIIMTSAQDGDSQSDSRHKQRLDNIVRGGWFDCRAASEQFHGVHGNHGRSQYVSYCMEESLTDTAEGAMNRQS
jgi:hypothetical protein